MSEKIIKIGTINHAISTLDFEIIKNSYLHTLESFNYLVENKPEITNVELLEHLHSSDEFNFFAYITIQVYFHRMNFEESKKVAYTHIQDPKKAIELFAPDVFKTLTGEKITVFSVFNKK